MRAYQMFLGLAGLLASSTAYAQFGAGSSTGSHIPAERIQDNASRQGYVLKEFARCMYRKGQRPIGHFLLNSDDISIDYKTLKTTDQKLIRDFGMEECLTYDRAAGDLSFQLAYQPAQIRSLLLEQDYLARNKTPVVLPQGASESVERTYVSQESKLQSARALASLADCITYNDTPGADALLRTIQGTKDERDAVGKLVPTLGKCVAAGQSLKLTPVVVRGLTADGMWQRYVRPLVVKEQG